MQYEVRCECGKSLAVSSADAGSSLRCACGRSVDVPPLHVLRASAGEQAISRPFLTAILTHSSDGSRDPTGTLIVSIPVAALLP